MSELFLFFAFQYVCVLGAKAWGGAVGSKERKWRKALKNASYPLKETSPNSLFILMVSGFTKCWVG